MGGTTAKASLIEAGEVTRVQEYEFRDGISSPSRFIKAGGYMLKVPAIDIAEVGAGGGSIAAVDPGGLLRVGPVSAGAEPGPACYGQGGERPTVTDANVVLGYLNPEALAGGALAARPGAGRAGDRARSGAPARPVRARGGVRRAGGGQRQHGARDPRGHGRARPRPARLHAGRLRRRRPGARRRSGRHARHPAGAAAELSGRVHGPRHADQRRPARVRPGSRQRRSTGWIWSAPTRSFCDLGQEAAAALAAEGYPDDRQRVSFEADLRFAGPGQRARDPDPGSPAR